MSSYIINIDINKLRNMINDGYEVQLKVNIEKRLK